MGFVALLQPQGVGSGAIWGPLGGFWGPSAPQGLRAKDGYSLLGALLVLFFLVLSLAATLTCFQTTNRENPLGFVAFLRPREPLLGGPWASISGLLRLFWGGTDRSGALKGPRGALLPGLVACYHLDLLLSTITLPTHVAQSALPPCHNTIHVAHSTLVPCHHEP